MANKIGKRFSSPYDRKRSDSRKKKIQESKDKLVPDEGYVHIFMDDERHIPESISFQRNQWVLARYVSDMLDMVDNPSINPRVREISLDWYMGHAYPNGIRAVEELLKRFDENENFLPDLEVIYFHSSDIDKCREMHKMMEPVAEARDFCLCINPRP